MGSLIDYLNSNRDDEPLAGFSGTKRGRRFTRRASAEISESLPESKCKIVINRVSYIVQTPLLSNSAGYNDGIIVKSSRIGRGRRITHAKQKEDN